MWLGDVTRLHCRRQHATLTVTQARPDGVAAIFFAAYMLLSYVVAMNLAIAILTIALEEVTEQFKVGLVCADSAPLPVL